MRVSRSSSTGAVALNRKRFADITNLQRQPHHEADEEEDVMCQISPSTRIYIDTLIKENMTLMRLIGERNKLIELSGAEMLKMKTNMQRLQVQNLNLAQSNSFMLAELNLGREKIKSLQHEIICKDAMLKAQKSASPVMRETTTDDDPLLDAVLQIQRQSRGVTRSYSMSRCMTLQRSSSEQEAAENKSPMSLSGCCMRRSRSARFKSQRSYARQHFFELDDPDYLAYQPPDYSTRSRTQVDSQSSTKTSNRAAERVQSCEEVPLHIRLR